MMKYENLRELVTSLIRVTEEENRCLADVAMRHDLPALAEAKARVHQQLDALVAQLGREEPQWVSQAAPEERAELGALMVELAHVAQHNGELLHRQIVASEELLQAIGKELRQLSGRQPATYERSGRMCGSGVANPLTINRTL